MSAVATEVGGASVNIASHLTTIARRLPAKDAIILTKRTRPDGPLEYRAISFAELDAATDRAARGLERVGIGRGCRTVLMVPPGREFFTLCFALFKMGAVVVLIDPGMGPRNVLACLAAVEPEAFIGISLAHAVRVLLRAVPTVRTTVTVGRRWFWGGATLEDVESVPGSEQGRPVEPYRPAETRPEDRAAILFTTGSTGVPKGAVYEHGMFDAQVHAIGSHFGIGAEEIDLPTFPLFALFDPALGMTAVVPDMDFTRPARVDPRNVIEPILHCNVTSMFGSPALLDTVSRYGAAKGAKLPTLRRVISAGAPVAPAVLERFASMMVAPGARIHTPYGATEALPVASIGSDEILGETRRQTEAGEGTCVGRSVDRTEIRILKITDDPIARLAEEWMAAPGAVGEICVRGPVVTKEYYNNPGATAVAKLRDAEGRTWHRMGDLGRIDERGRLWFHGRKSHRVETASGLLFTDPIEGVMNTHPRVRRSALVGVGARGRQRPVVLVELEAGDRGDQAALLGELRQLAAGNPVTRAVDTFLVYPGTFPVDIRHNAKIFREKLAPWAAKRVR